MTDAKDLTIFDKINLASCAAARAAIHHMDNERFRGEWETARLWKGHQVYFYTDSNGNLLSYSLV